MLKNITFSADEDLIIRARQKDFSEKSTLNILFRRWLNQYIERKQVDEKIGQVIESMDYTYAGKKFTRDEMNER